MSNLVTINIRTRNNADARRMGAGQISVPGTESVKHIGGHNVRVVSFDIERTRTWLDTSYEVNSYELVTT